MNLRTMLITSKLSKMYRNTRNISYVQGQTPENTREYFYFIDHQGMLFMDDARIKNFTSCFKDKKFLRFFFKRLKINDTGKYKKDFPFLSPCGPEHNFVRCEDLPIVFTHILESDYPNEADDLSYGHAGDLLTVEFEPEKIVMLPESGWVYHPGPKKTGGVGLISSTLSIKLSENFLYEDSSKSDKTIPKYLIWKEKQHELTYELVEHLRELKSSLKEE